MAKDKIYYYNHNTGEEIIREMTDEEQAERDAQVAAFLAEEAQTKADAEAKRAAAEAKLAALGLTADDLKALGLGGN